MDEIMNLSKLRKHVNLLHPRLCFILNVDD